VLRPEIYARSIYVKRGYETGAFRLYERAGMRRCSAG
jgi:hypothetical protein